MTPTGFLELRNVGKGYSSAQGRVEILKDINLTVEQGTFLAIVGYSGAGKTTLISILAGLLKADTGGVYLHGQAVTAPGPERALVFQNYSLLPWMTAYQNVALAVDQAFPQWSREQRRNQVEKYLDLVKLSAARDKKPHELSGGMRQRVSVARALATEPEVLLMDEPLSALDALTRASLQGEFERILTEDRKTVVLITNDVDEGILLADRIIPLTAGPSATLGPSFSVDLPRPRDRKELNHDSRFKELRTGILEYLLGCARGRPRQAAPVPAQHAALLAIGAEA